MGKNKSSSSATPLFDMRVRCLLLQPATTKEARRCTHVRLATAKQAKRVCEEILKQLTTYGVKTIHPVDIEPVWCDPSDWQQW
eukprot:5472158-Amphidinium_carterae.1